MEVSPEKSAEASAALSVDSNTSLSVWSNLYLVWLANEFLCGGASIEISMGISDRCPSRRLFEIDFHVLLGSIVKLKTNKFQFQAIQSCVVIEILMAVVWQFNSETH